ncbi:MAG TPA: hypothetical protein VGC82_05775 [Rhodopila sp.]|jgi:hypothetical protein
MNIVVILRGSNETGQRHSDIAKFLSFDTMTGFAGDILGGGHQIWRAMPERQTGTPGESAPVR